MRPRLLLALVLGAMVFTGLERSLPTADPRDFGSFIASANAGTRGENPYGVYPLTFHVVLRGFDVWNPNLNPPISVLFFRVFQRLETARAFRIWWSLSLLCYMAAVLLLARQYGRRMHWLIPLWAFAHAGLWDTLFLGQLYLPLVVIVAGSWLLLDTYRPVSAGVLLGILVAVKPNFLVWPALLLLAGHWRTPTSAAVTFASLWILPVLPLGADTYRQWIQVIVSDDVRGAFLTNASIPGLMQRLGAGPLGALLSIVALAGAAVWAFRRKPSSLQASALGIALGIAASPIAWVHYTLFLLPVFFCCRPTRLLTTSAALVVIPVPFVLRFIDAPIWAQATIGSAYNWSVLLCLGALTLEAVRRPTPALAARPALAGPALLRRTRDDG